MLALLIGVHVKTLRAAARDGRLPVTFDTRTTFRRLRARATPAAAQQFRRRYFGRQVRRADRRQPLTWASVPEDYDVVGGEIVRDHDVAGLQGRHEDLFDVGGCFRHQLLLPRPYLVLTKPLRLDIQCQRAASVKIGWKYLDD